MPILSKTCAEIGDTEASHSCALINQLNFQRMFLAALFKFKYNRCTTVQVIVPHVIVHRNVLTRNCIQVEINLKTIIVSLLYNVCASLIRRIQTQNFNESAWEKKILLWKRKTVVYRTSFISHSKHRTFSAQKAAITPTTSFALLYEPASQLARARLCVIDGWQ